MNALILETITLITSAMGVLMSLVLFSLRRSDPRAIRGIDEWALAPLCSFLASMLYLLQGRLPHVLTMELPNSLMALAFLLFAKAADKHVGKTGPFHAKHAIAATAIALFIVLDGNPANYRLRTLVVCANASLLLAMTAWTVWPVRRQGLGAYVMLSAAGMMIGAMALRAVTLFGQPAAGSIFHYDAIQAIYFSSFSFGLLLSSIAAILFCTEQLTAQMQHLLRHDGLTEAWTRRAIFESAAQHLQRSQGSRSPLSLVLLDVDHFKHINDSLGHQAGDLALKRLVASIRGVLRAPAQIGRYGGEEFLLVLPDTGMAEAQALAARIQHQLARDFRQPEITVSMGISTSQGLAATSVDAMVAEADAALYRAKQAGRNRFMPEPQAGSGLAGPAGPAQVREASVATGDWHGFAAASQPGSSESRATTTA